MRCSPCADVRYRHQDDVFRVSCRNVGETNFIAAHGPDHGPQYGPCYNHTDGMQETPVPDSCSLRLLAITGEIIDARTLAIFFFGSLKLLNLIVSSLCT
jgi:hypothetical protein